MNHFNVDGTNLNIGSQSFSMTDMSKSKNSVGVVYPYDTDAEVVDSFCVSSIIDHHHKQSNYLLKHTEMRKVDKQDKDLVYDKIETAISYVIMDNTNSESIQTLIKAQQDYCENFIPKDTTEFKVLREIALEFQPLFFLDKNHISQKYSKVVYENIDNRFGDELPKYRDF